MDAIVESEQAGLSSQNPGPAHEDLRDLIPRFIQMGELEMIDGADPHLELAALCEVITARYPGTEPALLFDNIKGYAPGFRILSGASNSFRRLAVVLGIAQPRTKIDLVRSYKARLKQQFRLTPPRVLDGGPVFENI